MCDEMNTDGATIELARDLGTFVQEQDAIGGQFSTFIACFDKPKIRDGIEFERGLWEQLAQGGCSWLGFECHRAARECHHVGHLATHRVHHGQSLAPTQDRTVAGRC